MSLFGFTTSTSLNFKSGLPHNQDSNRMRPKHGKRHSHSFGGFSPNARGFRRLDSIEGETHMNRPPGNVTIVHSKSMPRDMGTNGRIAQSFHSDFSPKQSESNWFKGSVPSNGFVKGRSFINQGPVKLMQGFQQAPNDMSNQFHFPLNVSTGEREIWQGQICPISGHFVTEQCENPDVAYEEVVMEVGKTNFSAFFGQVIDQVYSLSSTVFSTLNPYAKSFTPLNPNAREFTPSKEQNPSSAQDSTSHANEANEKDEDFTTPECQTPDSNSEIEEQSTCQTPTDEEAAMKSVQDHHLTPWISNQPLSQLDESQPVPDKEAANEEEHSVLKENNSSFLSSVSSSSDTTNRLLSTSSCSSDDSFIEFGSPSCQNSTSSPSIKRGRKPMIIVDSSDEEDDDTDEDSDEDTFEEDDDEDWDEVDECDSALVDIPSELEDFGLFCPYGGKKLKKDCILDDSNKCSQSDPLEDMTQKKIAEANARWMQNMHSNSSQENGVCDNQELEKSSVSKMRKSASVRFSSPDLWQSYYEDPELVEDLRQARISDLARRKADKARMENIIGPILSKDHRRKVYERLYGEPLTSVST